MSRAEAERVAAFMDRNSPLGHHYFAAHPEANVWAVFVVRPPLGKIEMVKS